MRLKVKRLWFDPIKRGRNSRQAHHVQLGHPELVEGSTVKKSLILLILLSGLPLSVWASPVLQYSATVSTTQDGKTTTAKLFVDNDKIRVESQVNGLLGISLLRPDRKVIDSIIPDKKAYVEYPLTLEEAQMMVPYSEKTKFQGMGVEKIGGQTCDKLNTSDGAILFVNQKTGAPVVMHSADGSIKIEWKDVKIGAPNAALFEPPADFQKMDGSILKAP